MGSAGARDFLWRFLICFRVLYFGGVLNKTIIPLTLVVSNAPHWLSTISYPTLAHGLIFKYVAYCFTIYIPQKLQ